MKEAAPPAAKPVAPSAAIEDGGFSIESSYWLTKATPLLRPGRSSTATNLATLDYPGEAGGSPGFQFSVPAGRQNTLRISYFRTKGAGDFTAPADMTLFSTGYTAGDVLRTDFKLQNTKVSWDFLSYTWDRSRVRFKTLWEAQYTLIESTIDAPQKYTADSTTSYLAASKKNLFAPMFGIGLEQVLSRHFRWEVKASGFGYPHRASVWDAQASVVIRLGQAELLAGEKVFAVKTSPRDDAYFKQTLPGAFVGIRYYWDRP